MTLDDRMQEGHEHEMLGNLMIGCAAEQRLIMLAPEGKEGLQQSQRIEGPFDVRPGGMDLG